MSGSIERTNVGQTAAIEVFGGLAVTRDGRTVSVGGPRQQRLLAALIAELGQTVPTSRLVELVWADELAPEQAVRTLQSYLSRLRSALGDGAVARLNDGYALALSRQSVSSERFILLVRRAIGDSSIEAKERLELLDKALMLWRGRPFGALCDVSFVMAEVGRLEGLRQAAVDARVSALIDLGRMDEALVAVELLMADAPLRERPFELAMIAYERVGRAPEALRVFQRCRAQLASESGLEPSKYLCNLEASILSGRSLDGQVRTTFQEGTGTRTARAVARRSAADGNPFKALRPFREVDATDFFGRDRLIDEALDAITANRFVTVVGPSGSGKSSLVRAGVVPALRKGRLEGSAAWSLSAMVPGARPWEELEAALLRVAVNPPATLSEQLRSPDGLSLAVKRILPNDQAELVLVIDQFEELWTLTADDARRGFLEALLAAVARPRSSLRVLATLRADFVNDVLCEPLVAESFRAGTLLLPPLAAEELERAIRGPLQRAGLDIEPSLLARLVAQTVRQTGVLPIMQYVLWRLYDERSGETTVLSSTDFDRFGGFGGTLAAEAEAIWDALDDDERAAARRLFRRLVIPGHERANTRIRATTGGLPDAELRVLDHFVDRRLLTADSIEGRSVTELSHEVLLRAWPRLSSWIDQDRDLIRQLRRLNESADLWEEGGRDPTDLLRGRRLVEISSLPNDAIEGLTASERAFLTACRHAVLADEATKLDERIREKLERSFANRDRDTTSALNLALDAHDLRPGLDTLGAVQGALVAAGSRIGELPSVLDAGWIDDDVFVTIDGDELCWWRLADLVAFRRLSVPDVRAFDVEPSRQLIVAGSLNGSVSVVDASTGSAIASHQLSEAITALTVGRDGTILVGTESGQVLKGRDVSRLEVIHTMPHPIAALSCSPIDGSVAAADGTRGSVVVVGSHPDNVEEFWLTNANSLTGTMALAHAADGTLLIGCYDGLGVLPADGTVQILPGRSLCQSPGCLDPAGGPTVAFADADGLCSFRPDDMTAAPLCDFDYLTEFMSPALRRSPDGKHLLAVGRPQRTVVLRTDGFGPINLALPRKEAVMSRIGRGGTLVATSYHDRGRSPGFRLWDISGKEPSERFVSSHPYCVFRTGDRTVVWEPLTNTSATWSDDPERLTLLPFSDRFYADIDFTPDFGLAFQGSVDGVVEVFDLVGNADPRSLDQFARPTDDCGMSLDVHPDGDRLLVLNGGTGIAVFSLPGLALHAGPGHALEAACWSTTGRSIVAVLGDELVELDGDTLAIQRRAERPLPGSLNLMGQGEVLSMSGDGHWIVASTVAGTQLVDPETLALVGLAFPHDPSTWCSAVDEVAPRLVTNDGPWVKVWELDPERWLSAARRFVGRGELDD